MEWVEQNTPCRFFIVDGYPDYHPEHPGGRPGGGRSLDNQVFSFDQLGHWADKIRNQSGPTPMTLSETASGGATEAPDPAQVTERLARHANGLGLALVGGLLKGCLDRGIGPQLEHQAVGLIIEDGRACGVRFDTPGDTREVRAARGVVLATGGFAWDPDRPPTPESCQPLGASSMDSSLRAMSCRRPPAWHTAGQEAPLARQSPLAELPGVRPLQVTD